MRILITGSSGMVGRNLALNLEQKGLKILTPNREQLNLLDIASIKSYLEAFKPDFVVHCAGLVGGISANIANPVAFLTQNAYIGLNLITQCAEFGIKNFLNLASSCMYPKDAKNPLKEEFILQGALEPTNEGYALAKILSARLCEYISLTNEGFLYKSAIPCNLYGKFDKFGANAHMIPAVIAKVHNAIIEQKLSVEIWGDGTARREFMSATDLADFIYYAILNFAKMPQNINVGLGSDYSINEYYEVVAKILGFKGEFVHDLTKPSGMKQKLVDITKLKEFGWSAKISLEQGISETYEYYLKEIACKTIH